MSESPPAPTQLTATVFIEAPYESVWRSWTEPAEYAAWSSAPCLEFGHRLGDRVAWGTPGRTVYRGSLLELEFGRGLAYTFQFVGFGFEEPPTRVDVELVEVGEVVLVRLTQDITGAPRTAEQIGPLGWSKSLSRLKTLLETGRAMPWPG